MMLEDLILEGQNVLESKWASGFNTFVDADKYEMWRRKALMFLQEYYPTHPQVKDFEEIATKKNNKYQSHPNCKCLYCLVYDPDGNVRNPRGLEKDLAELGKEFQVKVFIRPE